MGEAKIKSFDEIHVLTEVAAEAEAPEFVWGLIIANSSSISADASSISKNRIKMILGKSWKLKICVCCSAECQTCLQIQLHLSAVSASECQKCLKIHLNLTLVLALAVRSTA